MAKAKSPGRALTTRVIPADEGGALKGRAAIQRLLDASVTLAVTGPARAGKRAGEYKILKLDPTDDLVYLWNDSASVAELPPARRAKGGGRHLREYRLQLRNAPLEARVKLEREGVPSRIVRELIDELGLPAADVQRYLGIPKATFTSKIKDDAVFAGAVGQSFVGLMDLANKADEIVSAEPEDNEDAQQFQAERWLGTWIKRPQPALGGLAPAQVIDTPSGRESVMRLLGAIQSGAYL
jgi:uncharacterized protein (DUF2384 family)